MTIRKLALMAITAVLEVTDGGNALAHEKVSTKKDTGAICRELRDLHALKGGIYIRMIQAVKSEDGKSRILNIDVDGDDVSDEIIWEQSEAASKLPADPGTLLIKLSKGGQLKFQESRFSLFRHRAHLYLSAASFSASGEVIGSKYYSVNKHGIQFICNAPS